jgi:hypothetical protein
VLESVGNASTASTSGGALNISNNGAHCVLWLNRWFPPSFNWTFVLSPRNTSEGLNIAFYGSSGNSANCSGPPESIFDLRLPARKGSYINYKDGAIKTYSTSYFRIDRDPNTPDVANMRKNPGFHLVQSGVDQIGGEHGPDFHVQISKVGPLITVSVDGRLEVQWMDPGTVFGPVYGAGFLGLRQMSHTGWSTYRDFRVTAVLD